MTDTAAGPVEQPAEASSATSGRRRSITTVLIVIPAHDEEGHIGACLASVRDAVRELSHHCGGGAIAATVTLVLDDCRDRTAAIAGTFVDVALMRVSARCVGSARRAGVRHAAAALPGVDPRRVLVVNTDADSVVPPDWLVDHLRLAADHDLVLGEVRPEPTDLAPGVLARWHLDHPAGVGGLHGANLAVRLDAYLRAGGFDEVTRQEDVRLVRALRAQGAAVVGGTRVTTSGRQQGRAPAGFAAYLAGLALATGPEGVR